MPRLHEEQNLTVIANYKKLDVVLPHFGTLFGMNESVTAMTLIAMGCLRKHGNTTAVMTQGWNFLTGEFMLKDEVEVSITKFFNKPIHFIRVGYHPSSLSA